MGVIQIDSVNVLVRSQELPVFSRLGAHRRDLIPSATAQGELFEYWAHEAAHVPTRDHRLWRWKMERSQHGPWQSARSLLKRRPSFVDEVLQRVARDGSITAADLQERRGPKGSWWDWDDGKIALEYLFMCGQLTATRRARDFARVYDLPERIIPAQHLRTRTPSAADAQRELVDKATRSLGVGTVYDIADYFRLDSKDVKPRIAELVEAGRISPVTVDGWRDVAYVHADARRPRRVDARALVSMFDPVVWNRKRAERLFDFHYRIEIYTPAPKRRFGYYVLPFVLGDTLVGRVDLKADRAAGSLLVHGVFGEPGVDKASVVAALRDELTDMAEWLELDDVVVGRRGDLAAPLRRSLGSRR